VCEVRRDQPFSSYDNPPALSSKQVKSKLHDVTLKSSTIVELLPAPVTVPGYSKQLFTVKARISHYWPPLGPPNCSRFVNGVCVSKMSSGLPWQDWVDRACACPKEYPFGTRFKLADGSVWTCEDRGGAIVTDAAGVIWLDLLQQHASYPFGSIQNVEVQ
jgi:hypothetical protein